MRGERWHIFGDLCGHLQEFRDLIRRFGYELDGEYDIKPPPGKVPVSVGNLIGPGDDPVGLLRIWMDWVEAGEAVVVPGRNEEALHRYARGELDNPAEELPGVTEQLDQMSDREEQDLLDRFESFYISLPPFRILGNEIIVSHGGFDSDFLDSPLAREVRDACIHGVGGGGNDGDSGEEEYPHGELSWMWNWRGLHRVVSGGTPVRRSRWVNRCINLNNGPAEGGRVTMLTVPELELHTVSARRYRPRDRKLSDWPL